MWVAERSPLCPLVTGPMLADRAEAECVTGAVAAPLLLAPFAATVALACSRALELAWEGALVRLAVDGEGWQAEGPGLTAETVEAVSLHPASAAVQPGRPRPQRPHPPADVWQRLETFAARTYAPADPARTGDAGEDDPTSSGRF
jgi:hypothetical protein